MAPRPALHRLATRPMASDWAADELLTFAEAAALHFPDGPFTAAVLRRAHSRGELRAATVSGRRFTTARDIADMVRTDAGPRPRPEAAELDYPGPEAFARVFRARVHQGRHRGSAAPDEGHPSQSPMGPTPIEPSR